MKQKITNMSLKKRYKNIIPVSYCNLQHVLSRLEPIFYAARSEGWAYDVYIVDGAAICTGYAPIGTIKSNYNLARCIDTAAMFIKSYKSGLNYDEQDNKIDTLLSIFVYASMDQAAADTIIEAAAAAGSAASMAAVTAIIETGARLMEN